MKRIQRFVFLSMGAILGTGVVFAVSPNVIIPPIEFKPNQVERVTLSNGIVVYIQEDHELPTFDLNLKMKTSPADELVPDALSFMGSLWRTGGTKSRTPEKLNEELERNAIGLGTSADDEAASISVSCLSKEINKAMDIFWDVLHNPVFKEDQLALSKSKVLEGLRRKNETPAQIGRRGFRDILYGMDHVYSYESSEESIKRLRRSDLVKLHRNVVVPDNAMIIVYGDFDRKEMLALLEQKFGSWKKTGRLIPPYDYALVKPLEGTLFFVQKEANQSRIGMGRLGISRHSPDRFALLLANDILGGGGPSRLFGEIRSRRGLAYVVVSFFQNPLGPGMVGVVCQTKSESTITAVKAIQEELEKFTAGPIRDDEIEMAREANINSFVFGFDSVGQIVSARANAEFNGYAPDDIDKYVQRVSSVTKDAILTVAKKYFSLEGMKILIVGDKTKFGEHLSDLGPVTEIPLEQIR